MAESAASASSRLRSEDRRTALIEAAAALVVEGGVEAVSMDSVASRADVSRPLVYKHFSNRHELLAAVYRRQIEAVYAVVGDAIERADGFEAKFRAMVHTVLETAVVYGPIFTPLVRAGVRDTAYREEQRARNRRTVRFFTRLAMAEFGLGEAEAGAAMAILLSAIESVRAQAQEQPGPEGSQFLEDVYVDLAVGGLTRLASRA
jgi:AcrR family transcriptional regulator